jgi:hypothetical protein
MSVMKKKNNKKENTALIAITIAALLGLIVILQLASVSTPLSSWLSPMPSKAGSEGDTGSGLVANIELNEPQSLNEYGTSVTFDSVQIYTNLIKLSHGSATVLIASKVDSQPLGMNVSLGSGSNKSNTVVAFSMSDRQHGIQVQFDGLTISVHSITITVTFGSDGKLDSLSWASS